MTRVVLDDHLLRDLMTDRVSAEFARVMTAHEPATTNLYLLRLCRSVVSAPGGTITGSWPSEARRALGRQLVVLPEGIDIVPIRILAYRMAELASMYRLSSLGAEAVAAAEHLSAPLCVWAGDDGPGIRAAAADIGCDYLTVTH